MPPRGTITTRRRCVGLAAAALGTAALAAPAAQALPSGPGIQAGHNVTVFHNLDFVALFGHNVGDTMTLKVIRDGHVIGYAQGPTIDTGEGGGLEVNHGPEGPAQPGDCFTGFTPDIQPGDRVVASAQGPTPAPTVENPAPTAPAAVVDEVTVDDIQITEGPTVLPNGHVQLKGHARYADGTAIPVAEMEPSAGALNTSKFRGPFTSIVVDPSVPGGWVGTFDPSIPFDASNDGREPSGLDTDERREQLMGSEFSMGYGHVAPLPPEAQLFDGRPGDFGGPALGCEDSLSQSNRVAGLDDPIINATSGDLVVTGKAMAGVLTDAGAAGADIDEVVVTATDGTNTITSPPINVAGDVQDWTHTFSRAQLNTLLDGPITVDATYNLAGDGAVGGSSKSVDKETQPPAAALSSLPSGSTVVGPASLVLSAEPGATISYRTDDQPHGPTNTLYSRAIALPFGTTTFRVRVTDAAGNITDSVLTYTVVRPPVDPPVAVDDPPVAPPAPAPQSAPAPAPAPQQQVAASRSVVSALSTARRVSLAKARRNGLSASFVAPSDGIAVARLYRTSGGVRRLVGVKRVSVRGGNRKTVRFAGAGLKAGLYTIEVRTGANNGSLGEVSAVFSRVVR